MSPIRSRFLMHASACAAVVTLCGTVLAVTPAHAETASNVLAVAQVKLDDAQNEVIRRTRDFDDALHDRSASLAAVTRATDAEIVANDRAVTARYSLARLARSSYMDASSNEMNSMVTFVMQESTTMADQNRADAAIARAGAMGATEAQTAMVDATAAQTAARTALASYTAANGHVQEVTKQLTVAQSGLVTAAAAFESARVAAVCDTGDLPALSETEKIGRAHV